MNIELCHICKSFGKTPALRDVSLAIASGEKVGLAGPNGSGKSTLLRVVAGLVEYEGEARIGALDARRDRARLAEDVTYVPQIAPRFAAPVGEVVRAIGGLRGVDTGAVAEVAQRLGLALPLETRFRDLSGGQKQKLLLALALAKPTPVIVLDEPTASLDAEARDAFFALFQERCGSSTLVLSSHRDDDMRALVRRTAALDSGRIAHHA